MSEENNLLFEEEFERERSEELEPYFLVSLRLSRCKELTSTQKLLLAQINYLTTKKGYCWASNKYLAQCLSITEQSISNAISVLKRKKIIEKTDFDGRVRRIFLSPAYKSTYRLPISELILRINNRNILSSKEDNCFSDAVASEKTIVPTSPSPAGQRHRNKRRNNDGPAEKRHWAVEYWNSIEVPSGVPKHKNPSKKTYKDAARYLTQLHHGKFLHNKPKRREQIKGFFEQRRIPIHLAEMEWSRDELKMGLKRLSRIYHLDTKCRSLPQLIFNPYAATTGSNYYSYFFDAFYNHKLVSWRIKNNETEPLEKYVVYIHKRLSDMEED